MNPWEASALQYNFQEDVETTATSSADAVTAAATPTALAVAPRDYVHDPIIYPGLYAPSGFDMMSILIRVITRPNPVVDLGAVDASCALLMCDLRQADHPVVYASEAFEALTGYSQREILGRNCRILQAPPPPPPPPPPLPLPPSSNSSYSHHHQYRQQRGGNGGGGFRDDSGGGSSSSNNNNIAIKSLRQQMRRAIETNAELVVEVPNFCKDGRPFVNVLTMIPVRWDGCGDAPRYSVGFQVEKTW